MGINISTSVDTRERPFLQRTPKFSEGFIEELLTRIDIVEVIRDELSKKGGMGLRKNGTQKQEYISFCRFHNESSPSFTVSALKQYYWCFGCGRRGNVIRFLMEIREINYTEAVIWLARKAKMKPRYVYVYRDDYFATYDGMKERGWGPEHPKVQEVAKIIGILLTVEQDRIEKFRGKSERDILGKYYYDEFDDINDQITFDHEENQHDVQIGLLEEDFRRASLEELKSKIRERIHVLQREKDLRERTKRSTELKRQQERFLELCSYTLYFSGEKPTSRQRGKFVVIYLPGEQTFQLIFGENFDTIGEISQENRDIANVLSTYSMPSSVGLHRDIPVPKGFIRLGGGSFLMTSDSSVLLGGYSGDFGDFPSDIAQRVFANTGISISFPEGHEGMSEENVYRRIHKM